MLVKLGRFWAIAISSPRVGPVDPDHSGTKKYHNEGSLGSTGYTQLQNMVSGPPGLSRGLSVNCEIVDFKMCNFFHLGYIGTLFHFDGKMTSDGSIQKF